MIVPFRCAYSYGGRMRDRASLVRPERILSFKLHAVGRCRLSGPSRVSRIICRIVYFVQWFARPLYSTTVSRQLTQPFSRCSHQGHSHGVRAMQYL